MGPTNGDSLISKRDPTGDFKFHKSTFAIPRGNPHSSKRVQKPLS
jgi:hypothetical protein